MHFSLVNLAGTKSFATFSQYANILVVVAEKSDELKREDEEDYDEDEDDLDFNDAHMVFVIDANSSGIIQSDTGKTIGCNDVPFTTLIFSNVRAGKEQILSEAFDDRKISDKLIASSRLQMATLNMVQAKTILNQLIDYSIKTQCNGEKLRYALDLFTQVSLLHSFQNPFDTVKEVKQIKFNKLPFFNLFTETF